MVAFGGPGGLIHDTFTPLCYCEFQAIYESQKRFNVGIFDIFNVLLFSSTFSFRFFFGRDQILSQCRMYLWCCNALSVYTFRCIDTVRYNYRLRGNLNKTQSCNIRRAQPEGNFNGILPMSMILLKRTTKFDITKQKTILAILLSRLKKKKITKKK